MLQIVVVKSDGSRKCYRSDTVPFSDIELEKQVLMYYHGANCNRCRNAVLQSGFAQLIMDAQDGNISEASLALFPILTDCTEIYIKEK